MKTTKWKNAVAVSSILLLMMACSTGDVEPQNEIVFNNDKADLNGRMTGKNEIITVTLSNQGRKGKDFELVLKGELLPPRVDGNLLQATSVSRKGKFLGISYNYAGEIYAGAIDMLTDDLEVTSQAIFVDSDINELEFYANALYFAGGTSASANTAFVGKLDFNPGKGEFSNNSAVIREVGSYTANSVTEFGGVIYATSGNDANNGGGVYRFDSGLGSSRYQAVADARWMVGSGSKVFCVTGDPATLLSFDRNNLKQEAEFSHEAQTLPESKMTISIDDDMIFIAGGENGVLVYDFNGNQIAHLTFDSGCITNAVSAEDGKLFISNGESGVYVAGYDDDEVEVIGKLELGAHESVNHILVDKDYLYVASGLGGVKMIEIKD